MSAKFFKEDISKYREDKGCIPRSARAYYDINTSTIDLNKWQKENPDDYNEWRKTAVRCNSDFYSNEVTEGCCYNINENTECLTKDNNTGLKFLGNGDVGQNGKIGNICHKDEVQNLNNTLFDDTNKIVKFFKLILVSILSLLVTAIIGTCYEFWLRYGNSIECIYYKSKCANIGKTEKISLVDYMFPNNICYYPYQSCSQSKTGQSGGSKSEGIISNFAAYENTGAKCITLAYDTTIYGEKPFPYNIADFAANNNKSEFILVLAKTISFFFLFPILLARIVLNFIFSRLSSGYQKVVKFNPLLSNIVFLLLSGLLWPFIAYFAKSNVFLFGPGSLIGVVIGLAGFIVMLGTITAPLATIFPKKLFGTSLDRCNIPTSYYRIFRPELFYPLSEMSLSTKVFNIIKNLLIFFPIIFLVVFHLILGLTVVIIAMIYLCLSIAFNFLYIPLSNPLECMSILKSHADLLTILFCIGVIGSAGLSLDKTTTGIMSGILMLIIVYKSFKGMKSSF
jgi:hypothetical protein